MGPLLAAFLAACGAFLLWPIKKLISLFSSKKKLAWILASLSLITLGIGSFFVARSLGLL
jgi:predicted PurR-regulated permease PerM